MDILTRLTNLMGLLELPKIGFTDLLEIAIIAFAIYQLLVLVRNTRTWFLIKGIVILLVFFMVAAFLKLNTILFIAEHALSVIVMALLVVFQPELRRALEQLGKSNMFFGLFRNTEITDSGFDERVIAELVKASFALGRTRTGALMVIERDIPLEEFEKTGIEVDARITSALLINIFEHNTPLHDGAVIIRGDRVVSATCYLPLSKNQDIPKELGTRHRAAIGVSEVSDSVTIVVSEETGKVSVAENGMLTHNLNADELQERLHVLRTPEVRKNTNWMFWKGKESNEE